MADTLIEAVARALAGDDSYRLDELWETETGAAEGMRENYRRKARVALAAAADLLASDAEAAADEFGRVAAELEGQKP